MKHTNHSDLLELALNSDIDGPTLAARAKLVHDPVLVEKLATIIDDELAFEAEQPLISTFTKAKTVLIQFTEQITAALQGPTLATDGLILRNNSATEPYRYTLEDEPVGFKVAMEIDKQVDQDTCDLVINVIPSSSKTGLDRAGTQIMIAWDDEQDQVRTEETDAMGEAVFENIPVLALPGLVLEIAPLI